MVWRVGNRKMRHTLEIAQQPAGSAVYTKPSDSGQFFFGGRTWAKKEGQDIPRGEPKTDWQHFEAMTNSSFQLWLTMAKIRLCPVHQSPIDCRTNTALFSLLLRVEAFHPIPTVNYCWVPQERSCSVLMLSSNTCLLNEPRTSQHVFLPKVACKFVCSIVQLWKCKWRQVA